MRELFESDGSTSRGIEADIAPAVLTTVAAHATRAEFDIIVDRYRNASSPLLKRRYEFSLAALTDVGFAREVHELCRVEFRSQDAPYLLSSMMHRREIGPSTWEFVVANFDELVAKYPSNTVDRMLEGIASLADLDETGTSIYFAAVRAFVDANISGGRRRPVEQSVELLEVNLRHAERLSPLLGAIFSPR